MSTSPARVQTSPSIVVVALALSASACGNSSTDAEGAGSGSDTPSASPTHAGEPGEPELIQVEGYAYGPAPSEFELVRDEMNGMPEVFAGSSIHAVTQDGDLVGYLTLADPTPELMDKVAETGPQRMLKLGIKGMMPALGAGTFDVVTISGEEVWTTVGDEGTGYFWCHADTVSQFAGEDPEPAEVFVNAYLEEANG